MPARLRLVAFKSTKADQKKPKFQKRPAFSVASQKMRELPITYMHNGRQFVVIIRSEFTLAHVLDPSRPRHADTHYRHRPIAISN